MPKKYLKAILIIFILLSLGIMYLSTWSFGLDGDHTGYWLYSWVSPSGDFESTGKSPVFYQINYFIAHNLGSILNTRQSLAVPLFYQILMALSFSVIYISRYKSLMIATLGAIGLWTSALFYFNLTQFMMETPLVLGMFLITHHFSKKPITYDRLSLSFIFIFTFFLVSIKESVLPGILIIIFWNFIENKTSLKNLLKLLVTVAVAFFVFKLIIGKYQTTTVQYRVPFNEMTSDYLLRKLNYYPRVVATFLIFTIPALIIGCLSSRKLNFALVYLLGLLLASGLHFVSMLNSQRYYSPIIAVVLSLAFLYYYEKVEKRKLAVLFLIIIFNSFYIVSNYINDPFSLWPRTVKHEHIESGASVYYGFPVYRWLLFHGQYKEQLCVYVPMEHQEMNYYIERSFPGVFGDSAKVIHSSLSDAEQCPHSGIMYRSYQPPSTELYNFCKNKNLKIYEGIHRITYFSLDGHKTEENPGYLYNLTCI